MSRFTISASRFVPHAPERIYPFLADLANHRLLDDGRLRLERIDADGRGGVIVVTTPLGLRRRVRTAVTTHDAPYRFGGTALVGARTRALTHWRIDRAAEGAVVEMVTSVARAGPLDTTLLSLGGRWWLRRRFAAVLHRLAGALDALHPEPPVFGGVAQEPVGTVR